MRKCTAPTNSTLVRSLNDDIANIVIDQQFLGVVTVQLSVQNGQGPSRAMAWSGPEWLSFQVGADQCGEVVLRVKDILESEASSAATHDDVDCIGVLRLHGSDVPPVGLRSFLGMPARFDHRTVTVLPGVGASSVGDAADSVSSLYVLESSEIDFTPTFASNLPSHVLGWALIGTGAARRRFVLLDIEQLLGSV